MAAADLAGDAGHRIGLAGAVQRDAGIVEIDAVQRGGEAVGVALAAHLAVSDDVEAGALLIADGEDRRVVKGLLAPGLVDAPQLGGAHARREAAGELHLVDEPVGLGVGADETGGEQHQGNPLDLIPVRPELVEGLPFS